MLHFNELRITPDCKNLIIDVSVDDDMAFNQVGISRIDIYNKMPLGDPIYSKELKDIDKQKPVYTSEDLCNQVLEDFNKEECFVLEDQVVHYRILLNTEDLKDVDLSRDMLFVNVTSTDEDIKPLMGTVVNTNLIYEKAMKYIRQVDKCCSIPKDLIDAFLQYKAVDLSIKTGNYTEAFRLWNKFFKDSKVICDGGCN